jgi:RNA polymerase sigma-70 factor (ECF subfamily)
MSQQESFLKLLLEHERDIKAFIGSVVRHPSVCDEVFQDVALTLWEQFDRYDARRSFGAWARGVAANKVLQRRRNDLRFPVLLPPVTIQAVLEAFDRTEQAASARAEALDKCLQALPHDARELLRLRYGEEQKPQQIAVATGRTVDAIYQALCRIRGMLERCIRGRLARGEG